MVYRIIGFSVFSLLSEKRSSPNYLFTVLIFTSLNTSGILLEGTLWNSQDVDAVRNIII